MLHSNIPNLTLLSPTRFEDNRGYFEETYNHQRYKSLGIDVEFIQDNHSLSRSAGTIRGLHFQAPPYAQAKLVWCSRGAIYDVAVDIRKGSPTYGAWEGYELSADNGYQLYIPIGFAHGFLTLQPNSEIIYKCSDYYAPEAEGIIHWSSCGINWPLVGEPISSSKDNCGTLFSNFSSPFSYGNNT